MSVTKPATQLAEWSTKADLAERWKLSQRTIDARIADGTLSVRKFGHLVRIHRDEVERVDREGFTL